MTDTENKTEQAAAKKTVDTAPYMKKDSTTEPSKSNIVIPLVLLVVSAIVIFATFYTDEYNNLVADTNSKSDSAEKSSNEPMANVAGDRTDEIVMAAQSVDTNITSEVSAVSVAEQSSEPLTEAETSDQRKEVQQLPDDNVATMQSQSENNNDSTLPAYRPYQYRSNIQNPAKAHTQEQAQKYNEVMQQRRQAYEKEKEARRQQYEASMKAQQKKREQMIAAQKAEFQRMEEKRIETDKKIQELHNQISELHKQIHQLKLDLYPARINPAAE
jgi:septal ring factor EnvC (AmiA/AmiB activator)